MSTEARSVAKERALKYKNAFVEDDDKVTADPSKVTLEDFGGACAEEFVEGEDPETFRDKERLVVPEKRVYDILLRKSEREMATRPGRPRDQHKEMQRVAEVFGPELEGLTKQHTTERRQDQTLGATIQAALAHQKDVADKIREQSSAVDAERLSAIDSTPEVIHWDREAEVLLQSIPEDLKTHGPLAYAKHLAHAATLNKDQTGIVRLVADAMQKAWLEQGRPETMRRHGAILRLLLVGGGGCGKSRIINLVLTILFRAYWGNQGCVLVAPSNKAARAIHGKTMHAAAKLTTGPMKMMNLRTNQKQQTALAHLFVPAGALIIDECPQGTAPLYHALSLRSSYGRATAYDLELADYAEPGNSFGGLPIVIECGDELQLPPVPACAGLFADMTGVSTEHKAGVQIFGQKDYVYRLSTMKRFTDETLVSILTKMRIPGGCRLTDGEWKALYNTEISVLSATDQRARLAGTELWYQAAPTWATVAMAQAIRSRASAQYHKTTLYLIPAEDYVLDRPYGWDKQRLAEEIMRTPNMNTTARLPAVAMIHIGMEMRLTTTVEAPDAVVDTPCTVLGLDLEPEDMDIATEQKSVRVLTRLPRAVLVRLEGVKTEFLPPIPCCLHASCGAQRECPQCDFRPGCLAVTPLLSHSPFRVEVSIQSAATEHAQANVKVQRKQIPLTVRTASTLYTLQGITANPGLIFHWKFHRGMSEELRWLATYVALSRPPSLAQLRSIGMTSDLRSCLERGPPEGILTKFKTMFHDTELRTHQLVDELMRDDSW